MTLKEMTVGTRGRISGYTGDDRGYRHKLLRMGLTRGTEFVLLRKAPLGDPIEIALRGFKLTLRKTEAQALVVEPC